MHAGFGLVLVPAAISLWTATLLAAGAGDPERTALAEMEVLGVVPLDSDAASLLLLREKNRSTMVPIFVGRSEGVAVELRMKRAPSPRPLAADLLEHAIAALGGKVLSVKIEGARAAVFRARLTLAQGDRRFELEGRPSDSIALAVSARAPIYATREVIDEAGVTKEDLERLNPHGSPATEGSLGSGAIQTF